MKMKMVTLKKVFAVCKGETLMGGVAWFSKTSRKLLPCVLLLVGFKVMKDMESNRRKVATVYSSLNTKWIGCLTCGGP